MVEEKEDLIHKGNFWFSEAASSYAGEVDTIYYFIYYGSIVMFVGILGFVATFCFLYRRKTPHQKALSQVNHHTKLEIAWTVIPLILVLSLFYWGFKTYTKMTVSPANALEITIIGQKWNWSFTYPTGANVAQQLVLPVNTDIRFKMISKDVIHSFFVPSFRMKRDVTPNYYSYLYVKPIKEGIYQAFCAEFCGDEHSTMMAIVRVVSKETYDAYMESLSNIDDIPLLELGQRVYQQRCIACHSLDGSRLTGPSWKDVYDTQQLMQNGETFLYDDNYIRESIINPQAKVLKGYSPVMPSFAGQLKEREINGIIEYIKSLSTKKSQTPPSSTPQQENTP